MPRPRGGVSLCATDDATTLESTTQVDLCAPGRPTSSAPPGRENVTALCPIGIEPVRNWGKIPLMYERQENPNARWASRQFSISPHQLGCSSVQQALIRSEEIYGFAVPPPLFGGGTWPLHSLQLWCSGQGLGDTLPDLSTEAAKRHRANGGVAPSALRKALRKAGL